MIARLPRPGKSSVDQQKRLSCGRRLDVAQDPAALRNRLDEFRTASRRTKLLPELGNEDVDDLWLRLVVGAPVEMLQQHLPGDDVVAGERQQLQYAIFHFRNADRMTVDTDQAL